MMDRCERCRKEKCGLTMSMMNTEMICLDCEAKEKKRPDYAEAAMRESEEVRKCNYNFQGIGF